ncbi:DHA2 family efflux MFS transporter permease subunit [Rhodococcus sp. AG1013]|uniref:DHA2 family efflux MFS transporter permease subunit n=1 Tax=unclassified Rhodococcus (in: high G+C Gram-positive bacteria) TaxID=192944 RepID=UPI000E0B684E|nr:DHA2 family efflux MFS transporter permease subunit [Rhodococcus sp. AG1013]RDI26868.1 EmrB/QacA subfamily drug resistance transporter [Rhodococcus sp. AG1013]
MISTSGSVSATSRRRWWALTALSVAVFAIGIDLMVLTVALPTLARDLDATTSSLQWFSTSYTLVLAAALLPAGSFGDRIGRRKLLLIAMALFGLASLACAYSQTGAQLIGARAVLGLAAAAIMPMSMAVLPILFPDKAEQQRALTIWVTATALGLPLGPILGGWLLGHFWWGSVFLVNVPLVCVGLVAVALLVPESRSSAPGRFDVAGALLSSTGLLALTYGFITAGSDGWGTDQVLVSLGAGVVLLAAFLLWQSRSGNPIIDLALLADRDYAFGAGLTTLVNFVMFGLLFSLPLYLGSVLGADALGIGVRLLPMIAGLVLGTRLADLLARILGPGTLIALGFAALVGACLLGTTMTVDSGYGPAATWLTIAGVGLGLVMPTAMAAAIGALSPERSGAGSALVQALRQAGGTIGVAVLGTVLAAGYHSHLPSTALPEPAQSAVSDSVSSGVAVARSLNLPTLEEQVQAAFVHGMVSALWVSAALAVVGGVIAIIGLPVRRQVETEADSSVDEEHWAHEHVD